MKTTKMIAFPKPKIDYNDKPKIFYPKEYVGLINILEIAGLPYDKPLMLCNNLQERYFREDISDSKFLAIFRRELFRHYAEVPKMTNWNIMPELIKEKMEPVIHKPIILIESVNNDDFYIYCLNGRHRYYSKALLINMAKAIKIRNQLKLKSNNGTDMSKISIDESLSLHKYIIDLSYQKNKKYDKCTNTLFKGVLVRYNFRLTYSLSTQLQRIK